MTRALLALLAGNIQESLNWNPMLLATLLMLLVLGLTLLIVFLFSRRSHACSFDPGMWLKRKEKILLTGWSLAMLGCWIVRLLFFHLDV